MTIKRINEFPVASGVNLTSDDIFLMMDDPSGSATTKKVSLSTLSTFLGGGSGGTSFEITQVDLHNGGIQNAEVLKFNDPSYQSVITGPTPAASGNTAQRLIIQGQRAQGVGEGGDVYLWGGDADTNGGDIKIYAGDADNITPNNGYGGYVNIDGGRGASAGGNVEITAGYSESGQAGSVNIVGGPTSNGVAGNVVVKTNNNQNWTFGSNGNLTLPQGSILSETNNTVSIAPPTAASGQSLVIRPTVATWSLTSSGYIVYGSPITISVTLQSWAYFGTVNYTISGTGVTPQSLGRALTGKLTFVSTAAPDTETITWTIPANSNITEFTLTLTSVDGTRTTDPQVENNPALYYNFEENGMPIGQFVTVTNNGISNSEHSHIHLVAGDPSTVDIYLGDDDQYVKIQKDGGDVIVGTKSEAIVNRLSLITNGTGYAVTPNDVAVLGGSGTGMRVNYANSGNTVIAVALNTLGTGYQDGDILTLSGGNNNCTFRYNNRSAVNNNWTFGTDGDLTLPASGSIIFPDNTTQASAGVPSNTGLVPSSTSITNMVAISQANYNALATKNNSTLYVIT